MKFKLSIFLVFFSFILSSKCSSQATFFDYDLKNFDNFDVEEYDYGFDSTFTVFYKQQNPIFFNEVYIIPKKAEYKFVLKNSEDINKFFITFNTLSKNNTFQNGGPAYKTTSIFQDSIKRYFKELKKKYNDNSYFRGYSGDEELLNEILKQQLIFLKKLIEENQLIYNDKPSFLGSTTHTNIEWNSKEGLVKKLFIILRKFIHQIYFSL